MAQQYKIPQNLDIEDKILGPFTLKQVLYLVTSGITVYVLFNIIGISNFPLFLIISIPIAVMTLALVFVKINERPFLDFFFYFLQFAREPKQKKWAKSTKIKTFDVTAKLSEEEQADQKKLAQMAKRGVVQSQLSQMATLLDTRGWVKGDIGEGGVAGRIAASSDGALEPKKLIQEGEELDDIFSDIEGAVKNIKVVAQEEELSERLKDILG
uniref:PrgI family protein n=1 Tax=candidate division CPR3 bacterium TaxID=2268181 RepID=A0A7C4R826_UNCC3